jgi:hypothetical protein
MIGDAINGTEHGQAGARLMPYRLNVFLPGSRETILHSIEYDAPFMAIRPGDLLNPLCWPEHVNAELKFHVLDKQQGTYPPGVVLRVTNVEHLLVQTDPGPNQVTAHSMMLFTEALPNVAETRNRHGLLGNDRK